MVGSVDGMDLGSGIWYADEVGVSWRPVDCF